MPFNSLVVPENVVVEAVPHAFDVPVLLAALPLLVGIRLVWMVFGNVSSKRSVLDKSSVTKLTIVPNLLIIYVSFVRQERD